MALGKSTAPIDAAVRWHARLREPGVSAATRAEFERWLAADARHAAAYEEAERLWTALAVPAARALDLEAARLRRPVARRRFRLSAAAACLGLLVVTGIAWQTGYVDDLRSDYVTAVGRQRMVALADGSEVVLNTDSALAAAVAPDRRRVRLFRGEAWFSVAHDAARPFTVETPEGTIRVTGTKFNVRLADGKAVVSLVEGRVELTAADAGRVTVLQPGEQGVIDAAGVEPPAPFDANAATAWRRGQLVFYRVPLAEVVDQLNRYRSGRIVLAGAQLRTLEVSGVFDATRPDAALATIEDTLHLRAVSLAGRLIFLH